MKIKEFSNNFDLSYDTIRYYMKLNLINPQKVGGHYEFDPEDQNDMAEILKLKEMEFSLDEIKETSFQGASELKDPITTKALIEALNSISPASSLPETKEKVVSVVEAIFLLRGEEERGFDWLNVWRRPLEDVFDAEGIQSVEFYMQAVGAVVDGLEESQSSFSSFMPETPDEPSLVSEKAQSPAPQPANLIPSVG